MRFGGRVDTSFLQGSKVSSELYYRLNVYVSSNNEIASDTLLYILAG